MSIERKSRKRDSLNPRNWFGRSRSTSRASSERRTATSAAVSTDAPLEPSRASLLSHTSESSSRQRPSTSLVGSHPTPPLPTTESQPPLLSPRPLSSSFPSNSAEAPEPPTPPSDLWTRAFIEADDETQKWIRKHKLDSTDSLPKDQIKELIGLVESNKLSEQNDEPLKIEIGNQKIIVREYIADAVAFLTVVGDAAITFAPPQASVPWAVAKAVLKIPVKQIEQKAALLGTVQWFARIVRRGQIYEALYNAETTDDKAVEILYDALIDVYKTALELLASSDTLFSSGIARQTLSAILRPDGATGKVKDLSKKEQQLSIEVQACEAARSAISFKQANEGLKELKKQLDQLSSPLPRIDKSVATLLEKMEEEQMDELIHFISSEMFGKSHAAVTEARIEYTGDWLLANRDFRAWQEISSSSAVLCLKGTVGTGKTYLTSKVIDYVKQTLNASQHDEGFAFFYCNRSGPSMQDPIVVLRSFVRQLAGKAFGEPDRIQSSLAQKCKAAKREGRELGYKDCKNLILESLNLYSKTTIILDALDESDITTSNLCSILIEMMEESRKPVKILISTRPDRQYLKAFGDKCIITLDAGNQQEDIERFLQEKLYSTELFIERSQDIQDKIKNVFATRSCGMFRWVHLQVNSLQDCTSDDAIHDWARELPRDLTDAYDKLWQNIKKRNEHDVALAERAIMWVLCSFEPLQSKVLLEAIQYAAQGSTVIRKEKQTQQRILSLCQDLLTIDEERGVWMLPHASVAEYLETRGWMNWKCDLFASKVCLGFLENVQPKKLTFARYVREHWGKHVGRYDQWLGAMEEKKEAAKADPDLTEALKRFLGSPGESSAKYRTWARRTDDRFRPTNMALFAMCQYGFYYTLHDWWLQGKVTVEMALELNEYDSNVLMLAAISGCIPICRHLVGLFAAIPPVTDMDVGALRKQVADIVFREMKLMESVEDINIKAMTKSAAGKNASALLNPVAGINGRALGAAISAENFDVVKFLIMKANTDVNCAPCRRLFAQSHEMATAAQYAAIEQPAMLQWMVDQGIVDLERENDAGYEFGNILIAAASDTWEVESVRILLKAGANVNAAVHNGKYGSALASAAGTDKLEHVRLLLEHGADPNLPLKVGDCGSVLEASLTNLYLDDLYEKKREKIQHMLLEAGADPAAVFERGEHGSALAAAAFYGRKEILKAMIDRVGTERAIQALRQSRHPYKRYLKDEKKAQKWNDIATYLTEEVGVSKETLHSIGLWHVEPEKK